MYERKKWRLADSELSAKHVKILRLKFGPWNTPKKLLNRPKRKKLKLRRRKHLKKLNKRKRVKKGKRAKKEVRRKREEVEEEATEKMILILIDF